MSSLAETARKLVTEGPVKRQPTNRRIRGLLGGEWIFDTLQAQYVWEHQHYPYYYIPVQAIEAGPATLSKDHEDSQGFWTGTLTGGKKSAEVVGFSAGELAGLVKVANNALDDWYSEDEKLLGPHPKDPYTRIECLWSSRSIRVEVDGTVVARSNHSIFLHETRLRTRYYLPPTSVLDWKLLIPSDTKSFCPYKGEASYYHLIVGEKEVKDVVWYYSYPLLESSQVQNLLSFYNEKVDIFVDGVKEQK